MEKSPEAFRTISEVADWLGVPTHVLRFWESRFTQIKPVKRAGGRRYYRPTDMALIGGIKRLLHDDGMTIRGAQKLLREKGVKHVASLSQPLDGSDVVAAPDVIESTAVEVTGPQEEVSQPAPLENPEPQPEPETAETAPADTDEAFAAAPSDQPGEDDTVEPDAAPDEVPVAAAIIPATPDVPDVDPDDTDTSFPAVPGLAARLILADRAYLRRNRGALRVVKEQIQARTNA